MRNVVIVNSNRVATENKGSLHFFEAEKDVPFEIKRIYYITDAKYGTNRGGHAHKSLKQYLFCPYGRILIILDDGYEKQEIELCSPETGVLLSPCIWRDIMWLQDQSVLCVAVSDYYDEDDYIRDYRKYLTYIKENNR